MKTLAARYGAMLPSGAREAGIVFAGDVFAKFLTFLITLSLMALVSPAEYRLYGLFITVLAAVNQLADSGLHQSFIKYYALHRVPDPARAGTYLRSALAAKVLLTAAVVAAFAAASPWLARDVFRTPELLPALRIMLPAVLAGAMFEFFVAVFQARQEFGRLSGIRIAEAVIKTGVIYASVGLGLFSMHVVYGAYVSAPVLVTLVALPVVLRLRGARTTGDHAATREMLGFTKWLAVSSLAMMLLQRIDVFMIAPLLSTRPEEAGLYIAATRLCTPLLVFAGSVSTVLFPKAMAVSSTAEMGRYVRTSFRLTLPVTALSLLYLGGLWLAVPQWFPRYVDSLPLFAVLFVGYAWTILGNPITMLMLTINRARTAAMISLLQLAVTVCSHYVFITHFGGMGAAVSTVIVWFLAGTVSMATIYVRRGDIAAPRADGGGREA